MGMLIFYYYLFVSVNLIIFAECYEPRGELCVNTACTEPISEARGTVLYNADEVSRLSFKRGQEMTIISKTKNEKDYWGAIIDGIKGYVPSHLIQETKVYYSTDQLVPASIKSEEHFNETPKEDITNYLSKSQAQSTPDQNLEVNNIYNLNLLSDVKLKNDFEKKNLITKSINDESSSSINHDTIILNKYSIIEGTTVFDDISDQITPSTVNVQATTSIVNSPETPLQNTEGANSVKTESHNEADLKKTDYNKDGAFTDKSGSNNNDLTNDEGSDDEDDDDDYDVDDDDDDGNIENENEDDNDYHNITTNIASNNNFKEKIENYDKNGTYIILQDSTDNHTERVTEEIDLVNEIALNPSKNFTEGDELLENSNIVSSTPVNELEMVGEKNLLLEKKIESSDTEFKTPRTESLEPFFPVQPSLNLALTENAIKDEEQFIETPDELNIQKSRFEELNLQEINNDAQISVNGKDDFYKKFNLKNPSMSEGGGFIPRQEKVSETIESFTPSVDLNTKSINDESSDSINHDTSILNMYSIIEGTTVLNDISDQITPSTVNMLNEEVKLSENNEPTFNDSTQKSDVPVEIEQEVIEKDLIKAPDPTAFPDTVTEQDLILENEMKQTNLDAEQITTKITDSQPPVEESTFTSQITKTIMDWFDLYISKKKSNDLFLPDDLHAQTSDKNNGELENGNVRDASDNQEKESYSEDERQQLPFYENYWLYDNVPSPNKTFIYLVVTAVTVLLFTLGHNFIEKKGKSGPLIAKINKLEQKLFVTSKECLLLKEEVQKAKDKIKIYENSHSDELIVNLQQELEESKKARSELESSIDILQQELDSATEAGLDLNKMLSDVLTQKGGSESLLESVEHLQSQLNNQQKVIDEMTSKLGLKNEENENLQTALDAATEKVESLEEELAEAKSNLNINKQEKDMATHDLKSQIDQLHTRISQLSQSKQKEIAKLKKDSEDLRKNLKEKSNALIEKEEECRAIKNSTRQLKTKGNTNLEALFDVCRVKAELFRVEKENQMRNEELEKEKQVKATLENRIETLEAEVKKLNDLYDTSKKGEEEALKKLEVLSSYFKEKETQLQKELGCQEALWAQKKGDEKAIHSMMKCLQEEIESYKSQNETLRKEILDQERDLKNQIASLEQKAYENWVAARQAERKLEENKKEAAQLRNRLTFMEKNAGVDSEGKSNQRTEELNGVEAMSPALHDTSSPLLFPPLPLDPGGSTLLPHGFMPHPMFMPPPMTNFMPPPPFLPGDRRPPPLGRMSSPPLNSQFSSPPPPPPPPPLPPVYPFERMSPPPSLSPHSRSSRSLQEGDGGKEIYQKPAHPFGHSKNWEEINHLPGFVPISSQRTLNKEQRKGLKVSSGHSSSDSLEQTNKHKSKI